MHSNVYLFIVNHAFIILVRSMPTLPLSDEEAADKWIDLKDHFETRPGKSLVGRTGKLELAFLERSGTGSLVRTEDLRWR